MAATTIRIDDELESRIAVAAEAAGKTAHAYMLDAITQTLDMSKARADFHRVGAERLIEVKRTGMAIPFAEAMDYAEALARGDMPVRPEPRKLIRVTAKA